jgi:hypothetical protein
MRAPPAGGSKVGAKRRGRRWQLLTAAGLDATLKQLARKGRLVLSRPRCQPPHGRKSGALRVGLGRVDVNLLVRAVQVACQDDLHRHTKKHGHECTRGGRTAAHSHTL